jgi:DNA-binding transcriptional MerR regulator
MGARVDYTQGQSFFFNPSAPSRTYGPEDIDSEKSKQYEKDHGLKLQAIKELLAEAVRTLDADCYLWVFNQLLQIMQQAKAEMKQQIEKTTGNQID